MFKGGREPTAEETARQIGVNLMDLAVVLAPFFDVADGIKREMLGRGWSSAAAEAAALEWLLGMLRRMTAEAGRQ
ncbi:hypothetical protein [Streptomyces sp. NRRL S-350]|uniref:hypothetical protein n=1 Tax=Streptomyces sp. NRRL S-350 TaxID=1463902 RepID=UPI0004C28F1B|nr:hypothetical protein [Streptomyces sp. NRRL S-350]